MGFKSLFSSKRSSTATNAGLEQPRSIEPSASPAASTRSRSKKIARGVCTVFNIHRREKASGHIVADLPSVASHTTTNQSQSDMTMAAKALEPEHVLLPTPTSSSTTGDSIMASTSSIGIPPTTASSVSPDVKVEDSSTQRSELASAMDATHDDEKLWEQRTAMMKMTVQAEASRKPSPFSALITKSKPSTTTPKSASPEDFVTPDVEANNNNNNTDQEHIDTEIDYHTALKGLNEVSKVLEQRQAIIKIQPEPATKTPKKTTGLGALLNKKHIRLSPKDDSQVEVAPQQVTPNSPRKSVPPQPTRAPLPSYRHRKQPDTSNAACVATNRRRLIKDLAYRAMHGCDEALRVFEQLDDHFFAKSRGEDVGNLGLNFDGIHVFASQLGTVERTWLSRVNAVLKLEGLVERKMLGVEDYEIIQSQMFPFEKRDLMGDEFFEILVKGLGSEGIITAREVNALIALSVSTEELSSGLRWIGIPKQARGTSSYANDPSRLANFDIPQIPHRSDAPLSSNPLIKPSSTAVSHHLRTLVEAASYTLPFWAGYFFPDPRSRFSSFYDAWAITQAGLGTPPILTAYKRPWTYAETRVLQRGHMICGLLDRFEKNEITDFGLIRAIRGTFVSLPGQPKYDIHHLSTFLYHRIVDSGLSVNMIPEIMALHPEYDHDFANPRLRALVRAELGEKNEEFKAEEEERMREITESRSSFESMVKKELGKWGRVKRCVGRWCRMGKKEEVKPFDPFACVEE